MTAGLAHINVEYSIEYRYGCKYKHLEFDG
jgi:hypothetical protein